MLPFDEMRADLAEVTTQNSVVFGFAGTTFFGFRSAINSSRDLIESGFEWTPSQRLHIPLFTGAGRVWQATFTTTTEPTLGSLIILDGGTYKVGQLNRSQVGHELILGLDSTAK